MPDNVDFIQEQQAELLERQINAARVKHCCASALVCEECDAPIPAAHGEKESLFTDEAQAHLYGHVAGAARAFNISPLYWKNTVKG